MKRFLKSAFLILLFIGLLALMVFFVRNILSLNRLRNILQVTDINFKISMQLVSFEEYFTPFAGDGYTYMVIKPGKDSSSLLRQIKQSDKWNRLPLPENVYKISGIHNPEDHHILHDHYIGQMVTNGYYFFHDYVPQIDYSPRWYTNSNDIIRLHKEYSDHYILSIYDVDSSALYYFYSVN